MQFTKRTVLCLAWCALTSFALAQTPASSRGFIENKGQWDSRAQFLSRSPGLNMWVTSEGLVLDFHQFTRTNKREKNPKLDRAEGVLKGDVVRMSFDGSNETHASGSGTQAGVFNYIKPGKTVPGVKRFAEAHTDQIYSGISARYYFDKGAPRYDLVVGPGSDPSKIAMRIEGAKEVSVLPNGNLRLDTNLGPVEESGLTVYQGSGAARKTIPASMSAEEGVVHFHLGAYDKSKQLVIDPILFASYLGGSGGGSVGDQALAASPSGNNGTINTQYIAGDVESSDFPYTIGVYETVKLQGGQGFVAQVNTSTGALVWCSFLEGDPVNSSALVTVSSVLEDSSDNPIIGGSFEEEQIFPYSLGAYQTSPGPLTNYTGFICKLSQDGTKLLNGTYLSGSNGDTSILGLALTSNGNIMVCGRTSSTTFPCTQYAMQATNPAPTGGHSAFASEISSDFSSLVVSTYFGGNGNTIAYAVSNTYAGYIAIAGSTTATNLPTTEGCVQSTNNAASGTTGFMAEIYYVGNEITYGTYLGGSSYDEIYSMYDDADDFVCAGITSSTDLQVPNAYQSTLNGPENGFIIDIFYSGTLVANGTYLGGSGSDEILSICPGPNGSLYATGQATSTDFPTTTACYQPTGGTSVTAFVTQFNWLGSVPYSTYLGAEDFANAVSSDASGNAFIAGEVYDGGWIPTAGATYQTTNNAQGNTTNAFYTDLSPAAESLVLTVPDRPAGGTAFTGAVSLSSVAPQNGATVQLQATTTDLTIPASTVISAGATSGTFKLTPVVVSAATPVSVIASYNGAVSTEQVIILPPPVKSVVLGTGSGVGGFSTTGTVTLKSVTGPANMSLKLAVNYPNKVSVPATMTILGGKTTGTFTLNTVPVDAVSPVSITVTNDSNSLTTTMTVDPPGVKSLVFNPVAVAGTKTAVGTVTLTGKAGPSGSVVALKSANSAVQVPASLKIPFGATSGTFTATTSPVNANTTVGITATFQSSSGAGDLTVDTPPIWAVVGVPSTITGGNTDTGHVSIVTSAGSNGVAIKMSLSSTTYASVASTVTIPAGQTVTTFPIKTLQVLTNTVVTVRATLGANTASANITLIPIALSSFTLSTPTVQGGTNLSSTVTLTAPVNNSPIFVNLTSNNTAAVKPALAQVDFGTAGQSSVNVEIDSYPVNTAVAVTVSASYNGVTKSTILNVNPAGLSNVSVSPTSMAGGGTATITVTLTGAAGPAGTVVNLTSNNAAFKVPASVKVLFGHANIQVPVTSSAVTTTTTVTITATWNTLTRTTTLTLTK